MSYLVHYVVRVLEKTQNAVVQLDTHIVPVLFEAERTEKEVFEPVIAQLLCYRALNHYNCTMS